MTTTKRSSRGEQLKPARNWGLTIAAVAIALAAAVIGGVDFLLMAKAGGASVAELGGEHIIHPNEAAYAMICVAFAVALIKAVWLSAAAVFLRNWRPFTAAFCVILGVTLHLFSSATTIGFSATARDGTVATRTDAQDAHKRALARYEAARVRKAATAGTRGPAAIRADLATAEADLKAAAKRDRGELRTRRDALRSELAQAVEAERADADLAAADADLRNTKAPQHTDPQAEAIARLIPDRSVTAERVAIGLPLLLSAVVEFGATLAALIAEVLWTMARGVGPAADRRKQPMDHDGPQPGKRGPVRRDEAEGDGQAGNVVPLRAKAPKDSIVALARSGLSQRDIAERTGWSKTEVQRTLTEAGMTRTAKAQASA